MPKDHDDIRHFLELVESYNGNIADCSSDVCVEDIVEEVVSEDHSSETLLEQLIEDLSDLKYRFESHRETNDSAELAEGVELGLYKAAEMLENLLAIKYQRRI